MDVCIYKNAYVYMNIYMCVCEKERERECVCVCVCIYIYIHTYIHIHTHLDREAEITQFGNLEAFIHKHVLRLDVPVDYRRGVRVQKRQPCVKFLQIFFCFVMNLAVYAGVPLVIY